MIVRTCLLISDDPDDHIEFSEALYEISDDTVLVTVSGIKKAAELLRLRKCTPEFIFLNAGISDFDSKTFFAMLHNDELLRKVKVILYGDPMPDMVSSIAVVLDPDLTYSELKEVLKKEIGRVAGT